MSATHENDVLNHVLVNLSRSLLQYVGECWPWTTRDEAERAVVVDCVSRQRKSVSRIANLLIDRGWGTDYGAYPTEYTDLHFLELDFLLPQVVDGERALLEDLSRAIERSASDDEAAALLADVRESQGHIVTDLEALLAASQTDGEAA